MGKRLLALLLILALLTCGCARKQKNPLPDTTEASPWTEPAPEEAHRDEPQPERAEPVVGMWVSYLEWMTTDFSSEDAFRREFSALCKNCAGLGVNTLYVQVRPFADALYKSHIFPWSNYLTGEQGRDPGYDPLEIMVELAHEAGLRIEAWVNPYRIRTNKNYPGCEFSAESPAVRCHDLVKEAGEGLYFDPANGEAQQLIADGVVEIVNGYDVDGIQFDDYFYPTTDESFDRDDYAAANTDLSLADWRRENVNTLIRLVYSSVKAADPGCAFGISPQGNRDNNYNTQYSNVELWMSQPGYLDYVLPQTYWGFGYTLSGGSTRFAFENITAEWLALPRREGVELYFGLGAYRIGDGDGGANPDSTQQWNSGRNLADQAEFALGQGADGYGLYRYDFLAKNNAYPELAAQECEALSAIK